MCLFFSMGMAVWWLTIVWITNQFCTWDLEMPNNVLWKSIQYYSKYSTGQISLLRDFMKNQMLLPRFISLNSNNIQHKIIFCPIILNRILVCVIMGLTHCINYYPDFQKTFSMFPTGARHSSLWAHNVCLCHYASPVSLTWSLCVAGTILDSSLISTTKHGV